MRSGLHFIGGQQAAMHTDPLKGRVSLTIKRAGGSLTVEIEPYEAALLASELHRAALDADRHAYQARVIAAGEPQGVPA